jgi:hypothetical protein
MSENRSREGGEGGEERGEREAGSKRRRNEILRFNRNIKLALVAPLPSTDAPQEISMVGEDVVELREGESGDLLDSEEGIFCQQVVGSSWVTRHRLARGEHSRAEERALAPSAR